MAWGRIDDDAWCHARFAEVRPNAYALYWAMNSYSNSQLLDGHFTEAQVKGVATLRLLPYKAMRDAIENLIAAGLWEREPSGYHVHDYLDYNDSRADILARREERAESGRAGGKRSAEVRKEKAEAKSKQQLEASLDVASNIVEANLNPVPGPVPGPIYPDITHVISGRTASEKQSVKPPSRAMWDAFDSMLGASPVTNSERAKWNVGISELTKANIIAADIPQLVANWRSHFQDAPCNPATIARNLSLLRSPKPVSNGSRAVDRSALSGTVDYAKLHDLKEARERGVNGEAARAPG